MAKRKRKINSDKKSKKVIPINIPKSDDSGVSVEDTRNINNLQTKDNNVNIPSNDIQINKNLKVSINLGSIERYVNDKKSKKQKLTENHLLPSFKANNPNKSLFNFKDDASCLDYEPEDIDINSLHSRQEENCLNYNSNKNDENLSENHSDIELIEVEEISEDGVDSNQVTEDEVLRDEDEQLNGESNNLDDEDYQLSDEEEKLSNEDHKIIEADEIEDDVGFLENAKVNIRGFNITITRPVVNNNIAMENNVSPIKENNVALSHPNAMPVKKSNENLWKRAQLNLNLIKVVSNDLIINSSNKENLLTSKDDLNIENRGNLFDRREGLKVGDCSTIQQKLPVIMERNGSLYSDLREETCNSKKTSVCPSESRVEQDDTLSIYDSCSIQEESCHGKDELINRWLSTSDDYNQDQLLESICEPYFTTGCDNLRCLKSHNVSDLLKELDIDKLTHIYQYSTKNTSMYKNLFEIFLDCFKKLRDSGQMMLINMIKDIFLVFDGIFTDKTIYITKIIEALENTGLTCKESIERILSRYGMYHLALCDILLFIISKQSNLEELWCLVKKIISCRKDKIDYEVVLNFVNTASYQSENLRMKIQSDIFDRNLIDTDKMPLSIGTDFDFRKSNSYENSEPMYYNDNSSGTNSEIARINKNKTEFNSDNSYSIDSDDNSDIEEISYDDDEDDVSVNQQDAFIFKIPTSICRKKKQSDEESNESASIISGETFSYPPKRVFDNKVLNKVNQISPCQRSQTPANIITHPTRRPIINKNYICNTSLHNMYPEITKSTAELSTNDVLNLKEALDNMDIRTLLNIIETYMDPVTSESLVVHTLTLLKSYTSSTVIFNKFMSFLTYLEKIDPDYLKKIQIKVFTEILAMNIIYLLNHKCKYSLCREILLRVKDWHSLITSKIFFRCKIFISHMHRYIFLIKVLLQAKDYHWANELFQYNGLNLLEETSKWPYQYVKKDICARNKVLLLFLEDGFNLNIIATNDLLKHIILVTKGIVEGLDLWKIFNAKLHLFLDENKDDKNILESLFQDVVNYYHEYMTDIILLGYFYYTKENIPETDSFKLFRVMYGKGIYHKYMDTKILIIKTTMSDFEIKSYFKCYLEDMFKCNGSIHEFRIELKLSNLKNDNIPNIVKNRSNRSVFSVFNSVVTILKQNFNIHIDQSTIESEIIVTKRMLKAIKNYL